MSAAAPSRIGVLAVIAAAACFSLTPIWVRISEVGPIATGVWRFLLAAPVLWVIVEARQRYSVDLGAPIRAGRFGLMIFGSVAFAANVAFWHLGINETVVANAAILGNAHPIFVVIGAAIFYRERITRLFLTGLVLALIGTAWLTSARTGEFGAIARGDFYCFMSGFLFAFWVLALKQLRNEFSTATLVVWNLGLTAVFLLPLVFIRDEAFLPTTLSAWLVLIGFALTANLLGQSLFAFGTGRVSASFAAVGILCGPVLATFFGWLILGEGVTLAQVVAGGLVLVGIGLAERGRSRA